MSESDESSYQRWARFRFSVVGGLLACPPAQGELCAALDALAAKQWVHPITGAPVRFGRSTIERWFYRAQSAGTTALTVLRRKVRRDAGTHPSLGERLRKTIAAQHRDHRRWSVKLHYDNLGALVRGDPALGLLPSYSVVRRYMRSRGLWRAKGRPAPITAGGERAAERFEQREVRSYEATHVAALYHADFHECSRAVLRADGAWVRPHLFGCLCDRSRLACHVQWYWSESAETFTHGASQAFMKRGVPRAFMTDRGKAETAREVREGFERLGILPELTLPYSPYQNAKQEAFWSIVEGRLLPMLEGVEELTLDLLNEATQAWVELDYNREVHSEIGMTPLHRWLEGPTVVRDSPGPEELRDHFRRTVTRRHRRSDGTVTVDGKRIEIPSRYAHLDRVGVRYAFWDLSNVHLVDRRTDTVLCRLWPLDKERNADGRRRRREGPALSERGTPLPPPASGIAALLREQMEEYASLGLPSAYLPLKEAPRGEKRSDTRQDDDGLCTDETVLA